MNSLMFSGWLKNSNFYTSGLKYPPSLSNSFNQISSLLDAGTVYSNDDEVQDELRTFKGRHSYIFWTLLLSTFHKSNPRCMSIFASLNMCLQKPAMPVSICLKGSVLRLRRIVRAMHWSSYLSQNLKILELRQIVWAPQLLRLSVLIPRFSDFKTNRKTTAQPLLYALILRF